MECSCHPYIESTDSLIRHKKIINHIGQEVEKQKHERKLEKIIERIEKNSERNHESRTQKEQETIKPVTA